jgi:hypothetical protein
VGAVSKRLDFVAHRPDLLRLGVRLHDDQHEFTSKLQV